MMVANRSVFEINIQRDTVQDLGQLSFTLSQLLTAGHHTIEHGLFNDVQLPTADLA